jgi:regulator of sigma E protease
MHVLASVGGWSDWVYYLVVPFLFVLTIVVFFHELGHFLVARWCGIRVQVFSIGFGRELLGFSDRHGTRWKLAAIPLGGYVKFFGDENAASMPDRQAVANLSEAERRDCFYYKPVWQRAAV